MKNKNVNEVWASHQADLETKKGSTPIDWVSWEPYTIQEGKFLVRPAKNTKEELKKAAEVFRTGFPALRGCEFEVLYNYEGFYGFLGENENFNKGNNYMLVIEDVETGNIAATLIITLLKKLRRGEHLIISVHKDYWYKKLGSEILKASDSLFEKSGVEMAFGWCAAYHSATQKILFDLGYTPRAVIPGLYRLWVDDDNYRRSVEVFFQKFFNGAETMCSAELDLHPSVKEALVIPWR